MRIEVPEIYKPVFSDFHKQECVKSLWYSPRASWKSSGLGRLIYIYYTAFPDYDVCVGVDSLTNAGDGVLSEFRSFIENEGLNDGGAWTFTPKSISRKGHKNQVRSYAVQTNELHNVNATKSKKLIRPISLFIMDEVQKLHNTEILINCLSTFLRQMKAGHSKVVLAGNPDRAAMWFDEFYKNKVKDEGWITLKPTYRDIIEWITPSLFAEIKHLERYDPIRYKQIYLGDLDAAGWDNCFHSFIEHKHYVPREYFIANDNKLGYGALLSSIVIGVDDAERIDAIAASALSVRANGMLRVEESLYLSCKELPEKPALTERCALVIEYLDYINEHFNQEHRLPIIMVFDCAGGMYQQMVVLKKTDKNYLRWRNVALFAYRDKSEKEMQLGIVNTAFANGVLTVVNVDSFSPQYGNKKLVEQIKDLRLAGNGKIDPTIPNDCTDALQYAAMTVLRNPYSLTFPARKERYDSDYSADVFIEKLRTDNPRGEI
jgi:hypothetical protein